jgi:hypothetical protein
MRLERPREEVITLAPSKTAASCTFVFFLLFMVFLEWLVLGRPQSWVALLEAIQTLWWLTWILLPLPLLLVPFLIKAFRYAFLGAGVVTLDRLGGTITLDGKILGRLDEAKKLIVMENISPDAPTSYQLMLFLYNGREVFLYGTIAKQDAIRYAKTLAEFLNVPWSVW